MENSDFDLDAALDKKLGLEEETEASESIPPGTGPVVGTGTAAMPVPEPLHVAPEPGVPHSASKGARGGRVGYDNTVNPWYLISNNDDVTTYAMEIPEVGCVVLTIAGDFPTKVFVPGVKIGACLGPDGKPDGTHEMYGKDNKQPMHLVPKEPRRKLPTRATKTRPTLSDMISR